MDTYEKKYKKAQKWIESIYTNLSHEQQMEAEAFFPELKESEDEKVRKEIISYLKLRKETSPSIPAAIGSWIAWLEKQGEQKPVFEMKTPEESLGTDSETYNKIVDECVYGEPKPAWSEEDEGFLNLLLAIFTNEHPNGIFSTDNIPVFNGNYVPSKRIIAWLKSLKDRYTWKPNIAQLNALSIVSKGNAPDDIEAIVSLYNDLKKLTE